MILVIVNSPRVCWDSIEKARLKLNLIVLPGRLPG